jgi:hypothetical protein
MKDRLSTIGGLVLAVVIFGTCNYVPARSDYSWADSYTQNAEAAGWKRVHVSRNYVDPSRPWTILSPPPVGLYFIKPSSFALMADGSRRVEVLTATRTKPPIEESESLEAFNCRDQTYAYLEFRTGTSRKVNESPEWHAISTQYSAEPPATSLMNAVCGTS